MNIKIMIETPLQDKQTASLSILYNTRLDGTWCFNFSSGNNLELNHKKSVVCFVKLSLQIYTIANLVFQSTCVRRNFISVVGHTFYTKHADLVNVVKHNNGVSSH